jgi:hypothetical protein
MQSARTRHNYKSDSFFTYVEREDIIPHGKNIKIEWPSLK